MLDAVPDKLMSDLRADAAKPNPVTQGTSQLSHDRSGAQIRRGSGWQDERKLESPPGIPLMDATLDEADRRDRADLRARLARAGVKDKE
jgi:hypothetical protein